MNAAGNGWTAVVDGADILARTVYSQAIATGAVGTAELSTTEILVGQAREADPPRGAKPLAGVGVLVWR